MDDTVSSLPLPENVDEFLNFSPVPIPLDIFQEEYTQTTLFGTPNDTVSSKGPKPKPKSTVASNCGGEADHKRKKTRHRDFERQRRQEMAALYSSLRSLMPHEYLKGRSVADHMLGVVSYIQQTQKRVEYLKEKQDILRKTLIQEAIDGFSNYLLNCTNHSIKVEVSETGFQVMVSTGLSGGVPLSRVLDFLNREGLTVITSISTAANENMLHVIESQVNEGVEINANELQNKLTGHVF